MLISMTAIFVFLAFGTYLTPSICAQALPSRIERYLNAQVVENGFNGTVLVAHGDDILINKSFVPPDAIGSKFSQWQDRFPAGSISEQFIAAAILQLEPAGHVRLDSPICDYISDCSSDWKQILILHLLTHSSGLPSLKGAPPCVQDSVSHFNFSAMITMLSNRSLLFRPGNKFNGNKLDYFLLSLAIEKVSGQSTTAYLAEHIFHPLELAQTGNRLYALEQHPAGIKGQVACPQDKRAANPAPFFLTEEIYTTAADLYRWERALATGKLLPKNSVDQMFTPQIEGHGFGWKIIKEFDRKVALQNNELESTSVSVRMYPDDNIYVIVISRSAHVSSSELSHDLGAILFGKRYPVSANPSAAFFPPI
jgi:CubicO group peptidase (beta-lactamase class C family)